MDVYDGIQTAWLCGLVLKPCVIGIRVENEACLLIKLNRYIVFMFVVGPEKGQSKALSQ